VVAAGSLAGTALIVALVFSLGGWAYHHRGWRLHDTRLRRAVEQHPSAGDITVALVAEPGTRMLPTPVSDADWREFAARWPQAPLDLIRDKRAKWPALRVFAKEDVAYVLFFDSEGRLQDYALAAGGGP